MRFLAIRDHIKSNKDSYEPMMTGQWQLAEMVLIRYLRGQSIAKAYNSNANSLSIALLLCNATRPLKTNCNWNLAYCQTKSKLQLQPVLRVSLSLCKCRGMLKISILPIIKQKSKFYAKKPNTRFARKCSI